MFDRKTDRMMHDRGRPARRAPRRRPGAMLRLAACLLAGGAVSACASAPPAIENVAAYYERPYALGGGDTVRVAVYGEQELSQTYRISQSGHISVPLIGDVQAAGRSTKQIQREISERLANGYLRDPSVTVQVADPRPVFILGEVGAAGQYPYAEGMNGMKVVALAGGYGARAKRDRLLVTRVYDGRPVTFRANPYDPIHPGDAIRVPERLF